MTAEIGLTTFDDRMINEDQHRDQIEKWTSPLDRGHKNTQNGHQFHIIRTLFQLVMNFGSSAFEMIKKQ